MAGDSVKPRVLDDLMKCHMYIGYTWEDREPVKELHALLQSKGLECSVRGSEDVEEQSQADNIKQGIIFSHKCLLYISPDYLIDPNSQLELKEVERKWKLLGENSVFCIVQSSVSPSQFERYKQFQLISLKDGQTVRDCLTNSPNWDAILNDYELDPKLSLVSKENIGVGVAYTYYFSFLQIVVPDIWENFEKEIQHLPVVKEQKQIFLVKKMLIIIPKTLLSPLKLADVPNFKRTKHTIKQCYHRAGKENREYTIPIYELTDQQKSGNVYYFVTDIPSCLNAIREAHDCDLNIMSRDDVYETRNDFVLTLKALLTHPNNLCKFEDQWEILLWPDDDSENNPKKLSEFVSQQIESKSLAVEFAKRDEVITKKPIAVQESSDLAEPKKPEDTSTFKYAGGISAYPMYCERLHYALKNYPRGYCIIINNFDCKGLELRSGAATENEALKKLFGGLKFKVDAKENLTEKEMTNCLMEYRDKDHSESDAFVCCLLSHGEKGRIRATDKQIAIMKLMELFYDKSCPGLVGKPKLFFIGACQGKGEDEKYERTQFPAVPDSGGLKPEAIGDSVPLTDIVRELVPSGVDFIVSYACLPGTVAWRDSEKGGLYVQALCRHLNQDVEVDVALRNVNQEVRDILNTCDKEGEKYSRQDPFHIIMPPQKCLFLGSA